MSLGGGKKGGKVVAPQVKPQKSDIAPVRDLYQKTADMVEYNFDKEKDKMVESFEVNRIKDWPFTQTASDVMTEMALMAGVSVSTKNNTLTTSDLFGRLKDFKGLLDKADTSGNIKLNPSEIADRRRNTPDYGASLAQGVQGMTDSIAAKGGIANPGNAMAEAVDFGVGLLDMTLQTHMDRLQQIAGLTVPIALTRYGDSLNRAKTVYNATVEGPTRKFNILQDLADMEYDNDKFNIKQDMSAQQQNQKDAMRRAKLDGGGGGGGGGQRAPAQQQNPNQSQGFNPYLPTGEQQAISDASLYPIKPNPYAQQQAAHYAATFNNPMTGSSGGLFGGLF